MDNKLPELRKETKTIYVTSPEDANSAKYYQKIQKVLQHNPHLEIASINDIMQLKENNLIAIPNAVSVGMILINNPYDRFNNMFIDVKGADHLIQVAKFHKIYEIASLLGASHYKVTVTDQKKMKRQLNADLSVKNKMFGSSKLKLNSNSDFNKFFKLDLEGNFGGVYRISDNSYLTALQLAQATGLISNSTISALLNTRNPKSENLSIDCTVNCNLSTEVNQFIDAAFALEGTGIFEFNSNIQAALQYRYDINISMKFDFPER